MKALHSLWNLSVSVLARCVCAGLILQGGVIFFENNAFAEDEASVEVTADAESEEASEVAETESDQDVQSLDAAAQAEITEVKETPQEVLPREPGFRQKPGGEPRLLEYPAFIYESIPDINSSASDFVPVPDRWRMLYKGKWYDPYNQNILKGDLPIFGHQDHPWFFELGIVSDTGAEARYSPIPVTPTGASTNNSGDTDLFGNGQQFGVSENLIVSLALIQGNTTFKPQDIEFRFTPVFNLNFADVQEDGVLNIDPSKGNERTDNFIGVQELFADIHLINISDRYDFISSRIGIQPFVSDFRGFVYNVSEPGVRLFGNYDNNIWQFNLAYFRRQDKDSNSGNNIFLEDRYEDVVIANVYHQDAPSLGHTMQASVIYRGDQAGEHLRDFDNNGFLVRPTSIGDERPKNVYTTYFGLNGDGHYGRLNVTESFYYVVGSESHNQIAGKQVDVNAQMAAFEASYDMNWVRFRGSLFWASGDKDPFDNEGQGFSAIFDNPNFAGGDISFWQRQGLPFIGGGVTNLVNGNSLLPDLRPGKQEGQSNFVNPGLRQFNLGVDFEITPRLKLINNVSYLQFDNTASLRALRQDGSFDRDIGVDISSGLLYRPFLNQNVQFRLGGAALLPGEGLKNLYGDRTLYQVFSNVILVY